MLKFLTSTLLIAFLCSVAFAEEAKKEKTEESKEKTEKLLPPREGGSSVGNGAPKTPPRK